MESNTHIKMEHNVEKDSNEILVDLKLNKKRNKSWRSNQLRYNGWLTSRKSKKKSGAKNQGIHPNIGVNHTKRVGLLRWCESGSVRSGAQENLADGIAGPIYRGLNIENITDCLGESSGSMLHGKKGQVINTSAGRTNRLGKLNLLRRLAGRIAGAKAWWRRRRMCRKLRIKGNKTEELECIWSIGNGMNSNQHNNNNNNKTKKSSKKLWKRGGGSLANEGNRRRNKADAAEEEGNMEEEEEEQQEMEEPVEGKREIMAAGDHVADEASGASGTSEGGTSEGGTSEGATSTGEISAGVLAANGHGKDLDDDNTSNYSDDEEQEDKSSMPSTTKKAINHAESDGGTRQPEAGLDKHELRNVFKRIQEIMERQANIVARRSSDYDTGKMGERGVASNGKEVAAKVQKVLDAFEDIMEKQEQIIGQNSPRFENGNSAHIHKEGAGAHRQLQHIINRANEIMDRQEKITEKSSRNYNFGPRKDRIINNVDEDETRRISDSMLERLVNGFKEMMHRQDQLMDSLLNDDEDRRSDSANVNRQPQISNMAIYNGGDSMYNEEGLDDSDIQKIVDRVNELMDNNAGGQIASQVEGGEGSEVGTGVLSNETLRTVTQKVEDEMQRMQIEGHDDGDSDLNWDGQGLSEADLQKVMDKVKAILGKTGNGRTRERDDVSENKPRILEDHVDKLSENYELGKNSSHVKREQLVKDMDVKEGTHKDKGIMNVEKAVNDVIQQPTNTRNAIIPNEYMDYKFNIGDPIEYYPGHVIMQYRTDQELKAFKFNRNKILPPIATPANERSEIPDMFQLPPIKRQSLPILKFDNEIERTLHRRGQAEMQPAGVKSDGESAYDVMGKRKVPQAMCTLWECGRGFPRHRCPHNEAKVLHKGDRPCQLSEYRNKFNPYEINLRKSCKPDYKPMVNDQPIEDKTTNRQDYVTHQLEKPFVRGGENYVAPEVAVDCMTSYKKDYNDDYRKWAVPQTQRVMQENAYIPPDAEFQGVTNYKVDYPGHKGGVVRQSMKPAERMNSPGAFADSTGYRSEYVKHPMPDKPVKEVAQYIPNKVALDDVSNYKKDYVAKQIILRCNKCGNNDSASKVVVYY